MPSCRRLRAKKTGRACRGGYHRPAAFGRFAARVDQRSTPTPHQGGILNYSNAVMASSILAIMASAVAMESAAAV